MKILLVSSSSGSRGGGELYLLYLGRALVERGQEVTLWVSSHPRMDELAHAFARFGPVMRHAYANTYDRATRSIASYLDFAHARQIGAAWQHGGYDLLHLNKQNLEDGLDLLHAAERSHLPALCTIHLTQSARYLRARFAPLRDFIARRALKRFRGTLVTVLESRRDELADFVGNGDRLRVIANGVPLFDLTGKGEVRRLKRRDLGVAEEALLVIGVGRMVPQKRPMLFVEQAARIRAEIPEAHFVWIGDGVLNAQWDRVIEERGFGEWLQRLPWQADVAPLLLAADLLLHTAEFEGLPLAILEAMSAGLPCAVTGNLASEMPFLHARNSVTINDRSDWVSQLKDRSALRARGAGARELVEEKFSFHKMAENYETLYRETVATRW